MVIILSMGGLAAGAAGVAAYFHVGALSNTAQVDAIIMMGVGGGSGIVLFIIGIVGTVKDCRSTSYGPQRDTSYEPQRDVDLEYRFPPQTTEVGSPSLTDPQSRLIYGPEIWPELGKKWRYALKVLDTKIPDAPLGDVAEGRVRLYIPKKISINGEKKYLTLNTLLSLGNGLFDTCNSQVKQQFGDTTASGWIEIDRSVIEGSRSEDCNTHERKVKAVGCRMPKMLEAILANLIVFAFTGERLYGYGPLTYTRCSEKVDGWSVLVGAFDVSGLAVSRCKYVGDDVGVAALKVLS